MNLLHHSIDTEWFDDVLQVLVNENAPAKVYYEGSREAARLRLRSKVTELLKFVPE